LRANWYDLRDGCLTVKDRYGLAAAHGSKILTKLGFQLRDTHLLHDHMITRISHYGKRPPDLWHEPQMCWDRSAQRYAHNEGWNPRQDSEKIDAIGSGGLIPHEFFTVREPMVRFPLTARA